MLKALDSFNINKQHSIALFDSVLLRQEANVTEPGEREATVSIRSNYELYKSGNGSLATLQELRADIQKILLLNMSAIEVKNEKTAKTADNALTYISLLAAFVFLVGLSFSYNFPFVLTAPIGALKEGIQEISRKNYQYRIHLDRKMNSGQMADAFNDMAERLEHFENSNLNKIIFEKRRAEAVINSLKDASIGIDKNDTVLFANDQALKLLGMAGKDIMDKPVSEISKRNDLFRFLLEEKGIFLLRLSWKTGKTISPRKPWNIKDEEAASKVIVLRNITSFKELDVAKTNFIANNSHELKTPLASSDISLKLLEDERVGRLCLRATRTNEESPAGIIIDA